MTRMAFCLLFASLATSLPAQEPPIDQVIARHLATLKASEDAEARRASLRALNGISRSEQLSAGLPTLVQVIRNDPDAVARGLAIEVVALIKRQRGEPCPLLFVQSLFSEHEEVRNYASLYVPGFDEFEAGAVDVVRQQLDASDPLRRADALRWLAVVGKRDEKLLPLLRDHTRDRHFYVRHCAHWAVYRTTRNLEDVVPYCLDVAAKAVETPRQGLADAQPEPDSEQALKNLVNLSAVATLTGFLTADSPEFIGLFMRSLQSESAVTRRRGIVALGRTVEMIAEAQPPFTMPRLPFAGAAAEEADDQATGLELLQKHFLQSHTIETRLQQIVAADPDEEVRLAAAATVRAMTIARQKTPERPIDPFGGFLTPSADSLMDWSSPRPKLPAYSSHGLPGGSSNTLNLGDLLKARGGPFGGQQWSGPESRE